MFVVINGVGAVDKASKLLFDEETFVLAPNVVYHKHDLRSTFHVTSKFTGKNTLDALIKRLIQTDIESSGFLSPSK